MFSTRLWEKQNELNEFRISLARKLKNKFKKNIIIGVNDNTLSRKLCPDLILHKTVTQRHHFINLINRSLVCITSTGLHRSIGWRFGEFVAAGKAILSEPLHFAVPGNFQVGKNYLSFNSIDEVVDKCDDLLCNLDKIHTMEYENLYYYFHYLKPDILILNTLKQVFSKE